jgi:predicted GIY-YIG superfamily endonuclease
VSRPFLNPVGLLFCADGSYYVGQLNNVPERLRKHRCGLGSKHSADRHFACLIFTEGPYTLQFSVAREAQLKRRSRAKREALVSGQFEQLRNLAASRYQWKSCSSMVVADKGNW